MIRYTLALVFISVCAGLYAQKIDWANAPYNPLPVKYKAEHFNLKGPVYSADKKVFDERGYLLKDVVEYLYENDLPIGKGSVIWRTDAEGNIVWERYTSFNGRTTDYTYENGLLTEEKYHYLRTVGGKAFRVEGVKTFSYDQQERLIREALEEVDAQHGDKKEVTTYAYTKDGDSLKIIKTVQKNDEPAVRYNETYKDGYLIKSQKEGDPLELTIEYTFDSYGNPVTIAHVQNNGIRDEFHNHYNYYPDLKKENRISFGSANRKTFYPIAVFRNGEIAGDINFEVKQEQNTVIIYDDFSNSYYQADFNPDRNPAEDAPIILIAKDTDVIAFFDGNAVEPYYKGTQIFRAATSNSLMTINGDIISFASANMTSNKTTVWLEKPGEAGILHGKLLKSSNISYEPHLFYAINEEGNIQLIDEGKAIDTREFGLEAMIGGDVALADGDNLRYVLSGAQTNSRPGIYEARLYVRSQDDSRLESFRLSGFTADHITGLLELNPEELQSNVPAKVDLKNAPLNPIARVNHREEAGLQGDIAYAQQDYEQFYFDKSGKRVYPKKDYFTNKDEAQSHKGIYLLFDRGGKLIRSQGFTDPGWDTVYQYNPDGTLRAVYVINGDKVTQLRQYRYDDRGRVIKYEIRGRDGTVITTYSYAERDGKLIIDESVSPVKPDRTSASTSVYDEGVLIERTDTFNGKKSTNTFNREHDQQGNILREVNQDGREIPLGHYYHSELASPALWRWKNAQGYDRSTPYVYVNGRKISEIMGAYAENSPFSHGVFYEPITQRYLIARNAFLLETKKNPNAGGQLEEVASDPVMLYLAQDGKFNLYRYGSVVAGFKQVFRSADDFLLYEPRQNRTYMIHGFTLGSERFYPVEDFGTDAVTWYQQDRNSNITLIQNGEQLSAESLSRGGAYPNGDNLFLKDGKPWVIIRQAQITQYGKTHLLTPYDGRGLPDNTPVPAPQQTVSPEPYKPNSPLSIRNERGALAYQQRGKPTYGPSGFYSNSSGNAFAYYPPGRYHLFEKMNDFKDGEIREQSRTAIETFLAEIDGQTVRVWNQGVRLPEDKYTVFACSNGRKLLCIPSEKTYAQLAPENSFHEFRTLMPQWKLNFLIKNEDGSLRLIQRGKELTDEEVSLFTLNGNTVIYIGSDPSYMIRGVTEGYLLETGIYGLDDFSY